MKPAKAVRYAARRTPRTKVTTTLFSIAAVVVGLGAIITGGFTRVPRLPTGVVTGAQAEVHGRNVLKNSAFASKVGNGLAPDWKDEYSTAIPATYRIVPGGQEIMYAGRPDDTGPGHKIEVFQADFTAVNPGQQWRFQVTVQGTTWKSYVIVGMEWFDIYKHTVNGVTAYGWRYIAEADVYPHVNRLAAQQVAVTSPGLPAHATALAVYVQMPEINPATSLSVTISDPSLTRVSP